MERLTEEKQLGPFASLKDKAEAVPGAFGTYDCFYAHEVAVTRLKEYEDTGMTPDEIKTFVEEVESRFILWLNKRWGISAGRHIDIMQAERAGRLVVLPNVQYTDADGEEALRAAMWACNNKNNPITRYTADAIAEKLCREEKQHHGDTLQPEKKILDATCGARTIWFDKHHPAAVFCDKRREEYHHLWKNAGNCSLVIDPDIVCDFTNLPFSDNTFVLAIFDPPHLTGAKETAWLVKKYGKLDDTWPQMLHDGFAECMRVLKPDGVLIFKWSEYDIPAEKVWKAIGQKPLFGHHSGRNSKTFWGCFMKLSGGIA